MFDYILQLAKLPDLAIFAILNCVFAVSSVVAIIVIRKVIHPKVRHRDNVTIANMSAIIGVMYGVLTGLTALYLFNNNSYTTDAVLREASSLANIYRDSHWLPNPSQARIQGFVKNYIEKVITVEWPLMEEGNDLSKDGDYIINQMDKELYTYARANPADNMILHDMRKEIKSLYNARETRINMSNSTLSPELWIVIFIGTILTIGINLLFRSSFHIHLLTITAVGLMSSSMIFLIVTLDRPFQGQFIIQPDAFKSLLAEIKNNRS